MWPYIAEKQNPFPSLQAKQPPVCKWELGPAEYVVEKTAEGDLLHSVDGGGEAVILLGKVGILP